MPPLAMATFRSTKRLHSILCAGLRRHMLYTWQMTPGFNTRGRARGHHLVSRLDPYLSILFAADPSIAFFLLLSVSTQIQPALTVATLAGMFVPRIESVPSLTPEHGKPLRDVAPCCPTLSSISVFQICLKPLVLSSLRLATPGRQRRRLFPDNPDSGQMPASLAFQS
jgi:hypothetical protein